MSNNPGVPCRLWIVWAFLLRAAWAGPCSADELQPIRIAPDGTHFVRAVSGDEFRPWGVNYDHDRGGRLLEDYWQDEWSTVALDLGEIVALGANVVRIHLQVARFLDAPDRPNEASLDRLGELIAAAEEVGLYLDLTGLGCYDEQPDWYAELGESERWSAQACFWEAVARVASPSPAIFCYDLMNEPILPSPGKPEAEWLAGEFGGKHFVQRITRDLGDRTREVVAKQWVDRLVAAIRKHDGQHLITVGVIPWAMVWPQARPLFYAENVAEQLDFVSVHFYPEAGQVDAALRALAVYDIGKPLVIEETFPLKCSRDELDEFLLRSREHAEGWISFYWGTSIEEYEAMAAPSMGDAITREWLKRFRERAGEMKTPGARPPR